MSLCKFTFLIYQISIQHATNFLVKVFGFKKFDQNCKLRIARFNERAIVGVSEKQEQKRRRKKKKEEKRRKRKKEERERKKKERETRKDLGLQEKGRLAAETRKATSKQRPSMDKKLFLSIFFRESTFDKKNKRRKKWIRNKII